MQKIGNYSLIALLFVVFFNVLGVYELSAQVVTATVSETKPYKGERLVLTIEVSGENFKSIDLPELPALTGVQYLSTSPSTSQSFTMINGQTSRKYGYSYYLQATELGNFTIPSVTINVDGKNFRTNPIKITVIDRSSQAPKEKADAMDDLFIRLEVSNTNPLVNEQIQAKVVLYFKQNTEVLSYQPNPSWKAEGFWKEELNDGKEVVIESVVMNGVRYRKAVLMNYALFPSKPGRLVLNPFEVSCTIRVPVSANHPFAGWGSFGSTQRVLDLKSAPIVINARDLPSGAEGFSLGAVGQFSLNRTATKTRLLVGETVEVVTDVSGVGNIALINVPKYEYPEGFEIYDPQIQTSVNRNGVVVNGNKMIKDVLIARRPGTLTIPAATVSWYNNKTQGWQKVTLPELRFTVEKDPNAIASGQRLTVNSTQLITGSPKLTQSRDRLNYSSLWIWLGLMSPFMVFGLGTLFLRYIEKLDTDVYFSRAQRAYRSATKQLERAKLEAESGDIKHGYNLIHKALTGFIADRLRLPVAGLSDMEYIDALKSKTNSFTDLEVVSSLVQKCSLIAFAPVTDYSSFEKDHSVAVELLLNLKKHI